MRKFRSHHAIVALTITSLFVTGCNTMQIGSSSERNTLAAGKQILSRAEPPVCEAPQQREIEEPNYNCPPTPETTGVHQPLTVNQTDDPIPWELTLEQAVQITLSNSDVIRNAGGRVLTGAAGAPTVYDVALQEINPGTGVEAALSAFDAQFTSGITFNRDERSFNNAFIGGGATSIASNSANHIMALTKRSVPGTQLTLRSVTDYSRNNAPQNLFRSIYDTRMEGEVRQPLLRGAGIQYNRIAGPNGGIGNYNGIVIARIRTDIALADFEISIRTLMRDVENAYWQLYFAYRNLDARTAAYEAALASWQTIQDRLELGATDIEAEALARATFYQAKIAMQNALSGGGAAGQGPGTGVYSAERNLRRLMGVIANDGRLIRPVNEPSIAKRVFDWDECLTMALDRRVELRRQRWTVQQRESELLASKNFLLSQLDFVGLYRFRGFGDDLLGRRNEINGSAFDDLWTGDLQGWQLGLQFSTTLGKRREHAAVRTAELRLARERAVIRNQELTVTSNLSAQFAEMERAYEVARGSFNRSIAERQRLEAANAKYEAGEELLEFVLQAQQRTADADSAYSQALVTYNLAISDMHINRGSYLNYMGVHLSEGPWAPAHYCSHRKEFRRFKPRMNYCMMKPGPVSRGVYNQTPTRMQPTTNTVESASPEMAEPIIEPDALESTFDTTDMAPNASPSSSVVHEGEAEIWLDSVDSTDAISPELPLKIDPPPGETSPVNSPRIIDINTNKSTEPSVDLDIQRMATLPIAANPRPASRPILPSLFQPAPLSLRQNCPRAARVSRR